MSDETLIADLVRAGVSPELIGRVAKAVADATMSLNVRDIVRDMSREYERDRKRDYRANKLKVNDKPEANDAGSERNDVPKCPGTVPDNSEKRCDLSSLLSLEIGLSTEQEKKVEKEKKEHVERGKRGTRILAGTLISDVDLKFARDHGHADAAILIMWAEFVDFWIGVPGQRGTKLDWSATWRNRVRDITGRRGRNGQHDESKSVLAAADRQIERFGGVEAARAYVPGSSGPKPLGLDFWPSPPSVRLIPKG